MKNITLLLTIAVAISYSFIAKGQRVAPFALSPKWVFGNKGMFDFTTGTNPSQPARPAGDDIIANEGSSTLCDSSKNVMIYDNGVRVGGNNNVPLGSPFMNGSSSSDQGGLILPNPSSPYNTFFVITGNAESTYPQEPNDAAKAGINVYSSSQSGSTVTSPTFVSTLSTDPNVREYLYSSADNNYGYWVISAKIDASGNSNFYAWPISSTGTIGAKVTSSNASSIWNEQYQGAIKINRCQNKIALAQGSSIQVYNWDRTTGKIGSQIQKYINSSPSSKYYGCEFSPDGNYLFVSTLDATPLSVMNISTGTVSTFAGKNASGSLQLGPNGVIYIANGLDGTSVTSVGTITNPNSGTSATYNTTGLALANSSSVRLGISNIPWINPRKPTIAAINNSCGKYTFTPSFLTYFKDAIAYNTAVWDFGDGTAAVTNTGQNAYNSVSHTYTTTTGNKTITVTVTDSVCSYTWTGTISQNVPCVLPVTFTSINAERSNNHVLLTWSTATEINNNYFEVLRSSDGINFTPIGTVKGFGNSSITQYYFYNDYNSLGEIFYYKLVQHDIDGQTQTSNTVSVKMERGSISVYPNPSSSGFTVKVPDCDNAYAIITDVAGKEIYRRKVDLSCNEFSFGENLPPATYILQLITDNDTQTIKVDKR